MNRLCLLALIGLLSPSLALASTRVGRATAAVPSFAAAACPFALPEDLIDGTDIECGLLTTAQHHGGADGETVRLAVARLASTARRPAAEPLVILLGGPGQEVESILPAFSPSSPISLRALLLRQDVILLEQRGIGYSTPSLACPFDEVGGVKPDVDLNEVKDEVEAFGSCADGLRDEGVDLEAFDTAENAADVNDLRTALGYDHLDLLGISYGTRLALTVMRDFPDAVRSAVLASPVPLQADVVGGQIVSFDAALDRLFAACQRDDLCESSHPDLDASLRAAVDQLDAEPMTLDVTHPLTNEPATITIDGATFLSIVYVATFLGPLLGFVPLLIDGVVEGNTFVLETLAPFTLIFTAGVSLGANVVYNCNDEYGFTDAETVAEEVEAAGVRPELADGSFSGGDTIFAICEAIGVEPSGPIENRPVESDVPTLIMAGEYDPITPPSYGVEAAESLPNSFQVVFPATGHDPVSTGGDCSLRIIERFLANPDEAPDSSCTSELSVVFLG